MCVFLRSGLALISSSMSSGVTMKASTKRACLLLLALVAGYGFGFADGNRFASPVFGGVVAFVITAAIAAKLIAAELLRRRGDRGGWNGPPGAPVPRPPGGKPPVLAAAGKISA
jgi:hypothetical protein